MKPIHFAPLQGFTEAPFRRIHNQICGGIEAYYTPFIRMEHGQTRHKDFREAEIIEGLHLVPQVIAKDVAEFDTLTTKLIEIGHKEININMCCPFPPQTKMGRGSGLLPNADKVSEILKRAGQMHDEQGISFSAKLRLGQENPTDLQQLLPMLNASSLSYLILHPRTGVTQYKGDLDMTSFETIYEQCEKPLLFNGMLTTIDEIAMIEEKYPRLAGLMIGRGLLARPTLAKEYVDQKPLSEDEVKQQVLQMHRLLLNHYEEAITGGEKQLVQKMQTFWEYLEPLFGHKPLKKVLKAGSLSNYRAAVSQL